MQIIKSLNLNKTPASVKSGSLIFAKNIKVSRNGYSITGEEGFVNINYIPANDIFKNKVWYCVGCIETSKELILFLSSSNVSGGDNYIVRYKEEENKSYLVNCHWTWSGGTIDGAYYYNAKDQLIIAIGEHPNENAPNIYVPLKMINLDDCSFDEDESIYSLTPNVPLANMIIGQRIKNRIPQGIYQFFIRYKLKKNRYSNWFPLGVPVYAYNIETTDIINVQYQYQTGIAEIDYVGKNDGTTNEYFKDIIENSTAPKYELRGTKCSINRNNINLDAYSFKFYLNFYNRQSNISEYQIGFILNGESGQVGRIWDEFKIPASVAINQEFVFKYPKSNNLVEVDPKEFLNPIYNLYNVENVETFDNRFYFSNFKETIFNVTDEILKTEAEKITVNFKMLSDITLSKVSGYKARTAPITRSTSNVVNALVTRYVPDDNLYGLFTLDKTISSTYKKLFGNLGEIKDVFAYFTQNLNKEVTHGVNTATIYATYYWYNLYYAAYKNSTLSNGHSNSIAGVGDGDTTIIASPHYHSEQYPNIIEIFNNLYQTDVNVELPALVTKAPNQRLFIRTDTDGNVHKNFAYQFYLQCPNQFNWTTETDNNYVKFEFFKTYNKYYNGTAIEFTLYTLLNGSNIPTTLQQIVGGFEKSSSNNNNIVYNDIAAFNIAIPTKYNWFEEGKNTFNHLTLTYSFTHKDTGTKYTYNDLEQFKQFLTPNTQSFIDNLTINSVKLSDCDLFRALANYIINLDSDISTYFFEGLGNADDIESINTRFIEVFGISIYELVFYRPALNKNIGYADLTTQTLDEANSDKIVKLNNGTNIKRYIKLINSVPIHIIGNPKDYKTYWTVDNNQQAGIDAFCNTQYMYVPNENEDTLNNDFIIKCDGLQLYSIDTVNVEFVDSDDVTEKINKLSTALQNNDFTVLTIGDMMLIEDTMLKVDYNEDSSGDNESGGGSDNGGNDSEDGSEETVVINAQTTADNYSLVHHQAYNIFVHYVRPDGSSTNGIPLTPKPDTDIHPNNKYGDKFFYLDRLTLEDKSIINSNIDSNRLGISFEDISIPDGYIGCFFSMEKVDWQFNCCGIRPIYKKDFLCSEINLGKAEADSTHSYDYNTKNSNTFESNSIDSIYDSNVVNNVGQNAKFILSNTKDNADQVTITDTNVIPWGGLCKSNPNHKNTYGAVVSCLYNRHLVNIEQNRYNLYNSRKKVLIPLSGYYIKGMNDGKLDNTKCSMNYQSFWCPEYIFDISNYNIFNSETNASPTENAGMLFDTAGRPVTPNTNIQQNNDFYESGYSAGITPYISLLNIDNVQFMKYSRFNLNSMNIQQSMIRLASTFLQWGEQCVYNCIKLSNGFVVPEKHDSAEVRSARQRGSTEIDEKEIRYANEKIVLNQWVDISQWGQMFELKDYFIDKNLITYTNVRDKYNTGELPEYNNVLRRTAIFQNEAYDYSFMNIFADDYKIISNAKGIITRLTSLGNNLLIHTEHSLYTLAGVNGLVNKTGQTIDVSNLNLFEQAVQEIFSSKLGFGGLQDKNAAITNYAGYTFYDNDNKTIYNIDGDKGFTIISSPVEKVIKPLNITKVRFANDIDNNRLLICINTKDNKYLTLSYSYILKEFISLHDYKFTHAYNTKQKCYLANDVNLGFYKLLDNNSTSPTHSYDNLYDKNNLYPIHYENKCNYAIVDIIFNNNFEIPKVLNSIHWIFKTIKNKNNGWDNSLNNILVAEEPTDFDKPGDYIRIYSDTCSTDLLDVSIKANKYRLSQSSYEKKPYFDRGMWNMNYFRNVLNELKDSGNRQYLSDDNSLIYGKYFVIRFIIDRRNKFNLDNADINISLR